jgi:hypothetical protein
MGATLTMLQAGDSLLFCDKRLACNEQSLGLYNFNVLMRSPYRHGRSGRQGLALDGADREKVADAASRRLSQQPGFSITCDPHRGFQIQTWIQSQLK